MKHFHANGLRSAEAFDPRGICPVCNGARIVSIAERRGSTDRPCPHCYGVGLVSDGGLSVKQAWDRGADERVLRIAAGNAVIDASPFVMAAKAAQEARWAEEGL